MLELLFYRSLLNPCFVEERVMRFFSHFLHNSSINGTPGDGGQVNHLKMVGPSETKHEPEKTRKDTHAMKL
jgi:hypothetical protein